MNASDRVPSALAILFALCMTAPLAGGESDPLFFHDRASFESATAGIDLTTETFQGFEPGDCLDSVCEAPAVVDGVQFTSTNSDFCSDQLPETCEYVPVQTAYYFDDWTDDSETQVFPLVLGGGWAVDYGEQFMTDTIFELDFDPAVVAFGFDLVGPYPSVRVDIVFEDGSLAPPTQYVDDQLFFGALSTRRISRVTVETQDLGVDIWEDMIVGSPTGNYEVGDYALDDLSYNLPPRAPLCERISAGGDATAVIQGRALGSPAGGALDPPVLQTAFPNNLALTFTFETPNQLFFYVEFDELIPAAQGVVLVTDQAGGQCSLPVDFQQLPPGPIDGMEICVDEQDGVLVQIDNPPADESGPGTDGGTLACSGQHPDAEAFPPGYPPSPADDPWPCVEFIIESPVFGSTFMVYKKDGVFDPRLRLLFANWVGGDFEAYTDITESVEEIAYITPDPSRLAGKARWSPVRMTCAILDPDCAQLPDCNTIDDPGCLDDDQDGEPLCLMGQVVDCNDQNERINHLAMEICNGLDDNCNGTIDEGFDRDGDGIYDCFDNCPDHYNPAQEDSNGDGIGDACSFDDEGNDEDEDDDEMDDCRLDLEGDLGSDDNANVELSNQDTW